MNPASRLYEFLHQLHERSSQNIKLIDAYMKILESEDLYKIYEILHFYQQNLLIIEKEIERMEESQKYSQIIDGVKKFILPTNLDVSLNQHRQLLEKLDLSFMILADSFKVPKYQENDISKELEDFSKELDAFLENIMTLEMDDVTKKTFVFVVHKLKSSIANYRYLGIAALQEDMLIFKCIFQENEETKSMYDKFIGIVKKAKDIKGAIAFMSDTADEVQELFNLLE